MDFFRSPVHDSNTVARNENISFTIESRALIELLLSTIRDSSYTVAKTFFFRFENRLTSPVRNGTVPRVGMTRYAYAYTTQIAKLIRVQQLQK